MKKKLFVLAGLLALAAGGIGIVLPVLPTTPFLLLAFCCFTKGSQNLEIWFRGTKLYERYLATYMETKALSRKQKWSILPLSNGMIVLSFLAVEAIALRVLLGSLLVIHNYVILKRIPTRHAAARGKMPIVQPPSPREVASRQA